MTGIEGATAEQRTLLEELLAGMPSTRLEAFRIEPWDPVDWDELASLGVARSDPRHARPTGVALIVTRPVDVDVRGEWENELLGIAFRERSASPGLPPVLAAGHRHARGPLEWRSRRRRCRPKTYPASRPPSDQPPTRPTHASPRSRSSASPGTPSPRRSRCDLACCDPFYRTTVMGPPQPLCPILGAA
jgi:hypothetical protein